LSRLLKTLWVTAGVFAISGLACWLGTIYLFFRYLEKSPRSPVPATGNIYPWNNHGYVAYITSAEQTHLCLLEGIALGLAAIAGVIEYLRNRNLPRKPTWLPNAKWDEPAAQNQAALGERQREVRK
jgi:hypothetical protein